MTQCYEKPKLTVHGRVETLTQNTGLTSDRDLIIFTGGELNGIGGSRDFTGDGFQPSDPTD